MAGAGTSAILSTDNSIQCIPDPGSSSHTGLTVGLAVGVPVGLLILLAAAAFCFWRRRRRQRGGQAWPVSLLPVSMKGNGDPAALATAGSTPHDSGNSGQTSYTNGSGTLKLATERGCVDADAKPLQQQQTGVDVSGQVAGSATSGGTSLVSGFVPPSQPGSDYQFVARIRMNDTLEVGSPAAWPESLQSPPSSQLKMLTVSIAHSVIYSPPDLKASMLKPVLEAVRLSAVNSRTRLDPSPISQ
jgi:hypothetical protein